MTKLNSLDSLAESNFTKSETGKIRAGVRWLVHPNGAGKERHETFQFSTVEDVKECAKQMAAEPAMLMVEVVTYSESYKRMVVLSRWTKPNAELQVKFSDYPASHPDKFNNDSTRFNKWLGEAELPLVLKAFLGERENTDVVWMRFHEIFAGRLSRPSHHEFSTKEEAVEFLNYKSYQE